MNTFKKIASVFAAAAMALSLAACSNSNGSSAVSDSTDDSSAASGSYRTVDQIKESGEITIGVFSDKNPFGYVDNDGKFQGYDVYFADRIAKDLGVELKLVPVEAASRVEFLETAKVKPQHLGEVLAEIKDSVKPETVFISICAGISAEFIRERTIPNAKVVLVMPNTPMMLGCGASAMSHDETVSEDEFAFARKVIGSCGITEVIPTDKMKEIIAVNGSSPAFIYLYAKGFVDYADSVGIDKDVALRLFAQSLIGSAKMLTESGMTVDELIKQVSSPGGTTLAGLDKLYEGDLTGDVKNACEACTKRAYELGQ